MLKIKFHQTAKWEWPAPERRALWQAIESVLAEMTASQRGTRRVLLDRQMHNALWADFVHVTGRTAQRGRRWK